MVFFGLVFIAAGLGGCAYFLKGIYEQQERRNDLYEKVHLNNTSQAAAPSTVDKPSEVNTAEASS